MNAFKQDSCTQTALLTLRCWFNLSPYFNNESFCSPVQSKQWINLHVFEVPVCHEGPLQDINTLTPRELHTWCGWHSSRTPFLRNWEQWVGSDYRFLNTNYTHKFKPSSPLLSSHLCTQSPHSHKSLLGWIQLSKQADVRVCRSELWGGWQLWEQENQIKGTTDEKSVA